MPLVPPTTTTRCLSSEFVRDATLSIAPSAFCANRVARGAIIGPGPCWQCRSATCSIVLGARTPQALEDTIMQARMSNPAIIVPDAMQALLALATSTKKGGVPSRTLDLVSLRASQINGCSLCVDMHARDAKKAGETDER